MIARVLRPVISLGAFSAVVLAALTVYFSLGAGTTQAEMFYSPEFYVHHCNSMDPAFAADPGGGPSPIAGSGIADPAPAPFDFTPLCTENNATNANPNITTYLNELGGDSNFSNVITFLPNSYTLGSGIPAGTLMGGLRSNVNLGLLNSDCSGGLGAANVEFALFNVPLPNNANPELATNIAWPQAEGTSNRYFRWYIGNGAGGGALTTGPAQEMSGANVFGAIYGTASAPSNSNYPGYLLNLFDPDFVPGQPGHAGWDPAAGPASPGFTTSNSIIPLAVYGGITNVAGTWTPLHFAQFASGALTALGGLYAGMGANMGQPSQTVLNDPTAVAASPSTITDFCTPLTVATMLYGDPSGAGVRVTTPASAQTAFHLQYAASLRDTDGDGRENAFDTCPTVNDAPAFADTDSDRIFNSCDPTPSTDTAGVCDADGPGGLPGSPNPGDHDGDCFKNAQDNCPTTANATVQGGGPGHLDSELKGHNGVSGAPAPDNGPNVDTIGDPCDSGSITVVQNNVNVNITLSSTVANGRYLSQVNVVAKCIGGTDADGDGYCAADREGGQDGPGQCGAPSGHVSACKARHQAWTTPGHPLNLAGMLDSDGDGWTDHRETFMTKSSLCVQATATLAVPADGTAAQPCVGTEYVPRVDGNKPCAQTTAVGDERPYANWPPDFNSSASANSTDFGGIFPARLNRAVNEDGTTGAGAGERPYGDERFDLNQDGIVNTTDISAFYGVAASIPILNRDCGGMNGSLPDVSPPIPAWSQQ